MGHWKRAKQRSLAAFPAIALLALGGCDELALRKVAPTAASKSSAIEATCALDKARELRQIATRVQLPAEVKVDGALCASPANYACVLRRFSPEVADGQGSRSECAELPELGGRACAPVSVLTFNTREAARLADPATLEPGGDYNRDEWICRNSALHDSEFSVASGEGERLAEALRHAHDRCVQLLPHLAYIANAPSGGSTK